MNLPDYVDAYFSSWVSWLLLGLAASVLAAVLCLFFLSFVYRVRTKGGGRNDCGVSKEASENQSERIVDSLDQPEMSAEELPNEYPRTLKCALAELIPAQLMVRVRRLAESEERSEQVTFDDPQREGSETSFIPSSLLDVAGRYSVSIVRQKRQKSSVGEQHSAFGGVGKVSAMNTQDGFGVGEGTPKFMRPEGFHGAENKPASTHHKSHRGSGEHSRKQALRKQTEARKNWETYRKFCVRALQMGANLAPSLGLVGTIEGILRSFTGTPVDQLPRVMGMAMLTTYVGAVIFVVSYFALCVIGEEDSQ